MPSPRGAMSARLRPPPATGERRRRQRRGRPPRAVAVALTSQIVEAAMRCFLDDGYAATSLERVAALAGVSKRTLYARFRDKPALFGAAVAALIERWRARYPEPAAIARDLASALDAAGAQMQEAGLSPDGLALFRLLVAEGPRVPNLPGILDAAGAGVGVERVAALLTEHGVAEPMVLAEQFKRLAITEPQMRALGLGAPMDAPARAICLRRAVTTILAAADARQPGA
ncbi:MAG: TetR/AcrR family transcriptional regulator [Rhodospirillales bacterium]|nr:TetR/AcrR family transcriptional regulator [Rhodospirillales bacterium]